MNSSFHWNDSQELFEQYYAYLGSYSALNSAANGNSINCFGINDDFEVILGCHRDVYGIVMYDGENQSSIDSVKLSSTIENSSSKPPEFWLKVKTPVHQFTLYSSRCLYQGGLMSRFLEKTLSSRQFNFCFADPSSYPGSSIKRNFKVGFFERQELSGLLKRLPTFEQVATFYGLSDYYIAWRIERIKSNASR